MKKILFSQISVGRTPEVMITIDLTGAHHDTTGKYAVKPLSEGNTASLNRSAAETPEVVKLTAAQQSAVDAIDSHEFIAKRGLGRYASRDRADWLVSNTTVDRLVELGVIRQDPKPYPGAGTEYNRFVRV